LLAIRLASSRVNNLAADLRPGLILEVDIRERLSVVVADDKKRRVVPRLTTAAGSGGRSNDLSRLGEQVVVVVQAQIGVLRVR
jgi:phage baseplate assembly protein gpV